MTTDGKRVARGAEQSKNSHERAKGESYALLKSSVLSIDGEMKRQTSDRGVISSYACTNPTINGIHLD